MFDSFSFDGQGINGKDAHRSRLATLTAAGHATGVGPLFAASEKLLTALKELEEASYCPKIMGVIHPTGSKEDRLRQAIEHARAAIAEAEPDSIESVYAPEVKEGAD